jgi:hypothetical protein
MRGSSAVRHSCATLNPDQPNARSPERAQRSRVFFLTLTYMDVASLDRKRLGKGRCFGMENLRRGVFDKETRRKPLAFAADAGCYGI